VIETGPVVVLGEGRVNYRASAIGGCIKNLVALRLGYEPLPVTLHMAEVFQSGHDAEVVCKKLLRDSGWTIWGEQQETVFHVSDKIRVVGHIDGLTGDEAGPLLLEVKSQSDEVYSKHSVSDPLWQRYEWQVSVYLHSLRLEKCRLVRFNRETEEYDAETITARYTDTEIRSRVLGIERSARLGEVPGDCSQRFYPCSTVYLHEEMEEKRDDDPAKLVLARQYLEAQRDRKVADGRLAAARGALLDTCGLGRTVLSDGTVLNRIVQSRSSFDEKLMREDGLDIDKYKKKTSTEYLRVTAGDDAE
jgi:hypothetical protein